MGNMDSCPEQHVAKSASAQKNSDRGMADGQMADRFSNTHLQETPMKICHCFSVVTNFVGVYVLILVC